MTEVIKIFDPKDKPFGILSNNYKQFMYIDRKEWRTVSSYIYSSILTSPLYKQAIRLMKNTKNLKQEFVKFYEEEINQIVKKSTEEALKVKFTNEKLSELLISTNNSPILYVSDNQLLGIGKQNKGQNMYGKYLMQIRHLLRVAYKIKKEKIEKSERDQLIYDTYLAEKGLSQMIKAGNDIMGFINKSPTEIVNKLGRENLVLASPKRQFILENVHKGYLKNIELLVDFPENIVLEVRKRNLRNLRILRLKEKKSILLDMYADYILEKTYPDLEPDKYNKAKTQQFQQLGYQQKADLENRLFELFEQGMLSSRLSDSYDERVTSLYIPTESEVVEAENVSIIYNNKDKIVDSSYIAPTKDNAILVYPSDFPELDPVYKPYVDFSPISFTGMLNLYSNNYPTISHFVMVNLLAHIPNSGGLNTSYEYILSDPKNPITGIESFLHPDVINVKYENLRDITYNNNLEKYAKIALNEKFKNRILQDTLLSTGNAKLKWNDFSDPILGVGPKEYKGGKNFVGKYLIEIRNRLIKNRKNETLEQLHVEHITTILNEDPVMKDWLLMRVRDTCKVIITMKNYILEKDSIEVDINKNFVITVLDKVYQPCSHVFGAANKITAPVPYYFRAMVTNCPGFNNVPEDVIEIIWKRLAVMIYYLIEHLKDTSIQNLRAVLGRIELMVSSQTPCTDVLLEETDNCIISALLNIMRGIAEFNKIFSFSSTIELSDIKTAASIILNRDISTALDTEEVEQEIEQQELEPVQIYIEEEIEDDEFLFPDEDDQEAEKDYEEEEREAATTDMSQKQNVLVGILKEIDEIKNVEEISNYIEKTIEIIKKYPISKQVKQNRINFFATQRS